MRTVRVPISGLARKLRVQYPGAIYHVMDQGDRREAVFADDTDRERLVETLSEACQKTGWQVHAYCLMGEWGIPNESVAGRRVFGERMEWPRREDLKGEFMWVEGGWCLGGEQFRQELLAQVETRPN